MVKKLVVGFLLAFAVSSCFAGYSSGGRSGFSSSRSYSSSKSYSSARSGYSSGRSGYSRSTNTARSYSAPSYSRSYSGTSSSNNTVIHNNHYSHGGSGWGGGFFSGMLGGYLGGSLANSHHAPVIVNGAAAPVVAEPMMQGQGMLVNGGYAAPSHNPMNTLLGIVGIIAVLLIIFWGLRMLFVTFFQDDHNCNHKRNRW